jgi:hypothetical protein
MGSCAFDTSWLEMAEVLSMTITLTIRTLRNVSFVIGGFEFDFTLLKMFYFKDIFVVRSRFEVNEEHGER